MLLGMPKYDKVRLAISRGLYVLDVVVMLFVF